MTTTAATGPEPGAVASLEYQVEALTEALAEANLSAHRLLDGEDQGWRSVLGDADVISRDDIIDTARVARVMVAADPLIKRGVGLRVAYLGHPQVTAATDDTGGEGAGQDVNAVVQ